MNKNAIENIREFLNDSKPDDILQIVREINSYNGYCESLCWEYMDDFDDLNNGLSPIEIARRCFYGDFCPAHEYWKYDAYSNFESCDYISFDNNDIEEIIEAIQSIPFGYLPVEIQNIIIECKEIDD